MALPEPSWRLSLLGRPALTDASGRTFALEGKTAAVLAYLALEGPTPRSRLAGLLWPEATESAARNNLVHVLRRLGRRCGADLVDTGAALALRSVVRVDDAGLLRGADGLPVPPRAEPLLEGVRLSDAPEWEAWVRAARERVTERRLRSWRRTAKDLEAQGRLREAEEVAAAAAALDALSEHAHRDLMRLRYLQGDRAGALGAYRAFRRRLRDELNTEPTSTTAELARLVEQGGRLPEAARRPVAADTEHPTVPPFVRRDDEWARLEDAWAAGKTPLVTGPPGSGKTRLAFEFARSKGTPVVFECRPGDAYAPFSSLARMMRMYLELGDVAALPLEERRALARVLPDVAADTAPAEAPRDDASRAAFFERLDRVATLATRHLSAPVQLVDDWQYMDDATNEGTLWHLRHRANLPGVRSVLTWRSGELPAASRRLVDEAVASGTAALVELSELSAAQVRRMLTGLGVAADDALSARVTSLTNGNALFVRETASYLRDVDAARAAPPEELLPFGAGDGVIERRFARLGPAALQALRAAAVLESDVDVELVARLLDAPLLTTAAAWEELERAGMVRGRRVTHALVFEAAQRATPRAVRETLHRNAARTLAALGASPARVARHWANGGAPREAAEWWMRAGDEATRDGRRDDARARYAAAEDAFAAASDDAGRARAAAARG